MDPNDGLRAVNAGTYDHDAADNLTRLASGATLSYDSANQLTTLSDANRSAGAIRFGR